MRVGFPDFALPGYVLLPEPVIAAQNATGSGMVFHPRNRAVACAGTGSEPEFGVRIKDRGLCRIKSDAGYLAGAQLARRADETGDVEIDRTIVDLVRRIKLLDDAVA
jgi:hypothetical protein